MRRATLSAPPIFAVSERVPGRVTLVSDTAAIAHIFVLEDDILRLLLLPRGTIEGPPSWAIAPGAEDIGEPGRDRMSVEGFRCPDFQLEQQAGTLRIETTRLRLEILLDGFHCTWSQREGDDWRPMAADRPTQSYDFGWWDGRVRHYLARRPGERFYGLGERSGAMDRAGRRFRLTSYDPMGYDAEITDPLYKAIPYLLVADAEGACHGAFYDNMSDAAFDLGCEIDNYHGDYRYFAAEGGDLDLYMIAGPDPAAVTRRFTWLTGRPALMPRWATGYSGSTMTYTDAPDAQARMGEFIEKLEEHDIGCTSFHFSSGYTSIGPKRYVFNWNRDKFPDPATFVQSYRAAGIELVPNIKPALLRDHPRYQDLEGRGLFVTDADGQTIECQYWDELCAFVDFTEPAAAAWWRENLTAALLDYGMRASWNDNNEYGIWDDRACFSFWGQPRKAAEARPLQALLMMRASRAAQIAQDPDRRPYVVTRSGMAGLQRYAQTWTGDNRTDWKTIRYNIKMGLGLALSGISNSGHDVGGFAGRKPEPELFLRWVQAGIFMPRFSIHSWNDDGSVNEPWMYPEILPAIRRLMAFRQTLAPYLYDLQWRYHRDYEPMVRPIWHDFPADPAAWTDGDDHLLGRDLLVALVVEAGADTRAVRAPAGTNWVNPWSGDRVEGGAIVVLPASIDQLPPVLAREGSAIPVDLARGGFRPGAFDRGLWLFPPIGDATFDWHFHEDQGELIAVPDRWSGRCRTTADAVIVEVHREGSRSFGDDRLTLLLPPTDNRRIIIEGHSATPRDVDGRRGVQIALIN